MNSASRNCEETSLQNEPCLFQLDQGNEVQKSVEALPQVQQLTRDLESCNWEQLQEKFANAMDEHGRAEETLRSQTAQLLQVLVAWSQVTMLRDETRALKRFKTQMQHVQNSEEKMENKKKHYIEVVKAFENALALLNDRLKL